MMNSNIFKTILLILLISCKSHHIENRYEDNRNSINYITRDFQYLKIGEKSGVYTYPKINLIFTLKKGKLHGMMSLIKENDTLYFCRYNENQPVGKYINKLYLEKYNSYKQILTLSPVNVIDGEGFYNNNHKKEGFWKEFYGNCDKKGYYFNGLKNGLWEENCFNDAGAYEYRRNVIYKNDSIVSYTKN